MPFRTMNDNGQKAELMMTFRTMNDSRGEKTMGKKGTRRRQNIVKFRKCQNEKRDKKGKKMVV